MFTFLTKFLKLSYKATYSRQQIDEIPKYLIKELQST